MLVFSEGKYFALDIFTGLDTSTGFADGRCSCSIVDDKEVWWALPDVRILCNAGDRTPHVKL